MNLDTNGKDHIIGLTADVVAAYVSNNSVPKDQLASLISDVHATLHKVGGATATAPAAEPQAPAVNPKKSVTPDFIICLEDGKKFKSLKRHLNTSYDMTPDQYRQKWNLPQDYPMVAPNYTAKRSQLAKMSGLGRRPAPVPAPIKGRAKAKSAKA